MIYKRGKVFWVKYDSGDKPIREGIGMAKQKEAERLLNDREGRVAMDPPLLPKVQRTTVDDLLTDLKAHDETTGQHDFRRSVARNMERAGVPRSVAMKMSGHRTECIYRRYAIVSELDIQDAATARAQSGHTPLPVG